MEEWGKEGGGGIAAVSHHHLAIDKSLHQLDQPRLALHRRQKYGESWWLSFMAEADIAAIRCGDVYEVTSIRLTRLLKNQQ